MPSLSPLSSLDGNVMNQVIWNNKKILSQGKSLYQPLFHKCEIIKVGDLISNDRTFLKSEKVPGGYSWEFFVGVCRPVLQILIRFQIKKRCSFPHPFSDQTSKIHSRFQLLRLEFKEENYSNPFQIRIFLFLSHSFGIETINTFIHSRSSFRFLRKPYPIPDQNGQSVQGGTYLYGLYKGVPPPRPLGEKVLKAQLSAESVFWMGVVNAILSGWRSIRKGNVLTALSLLDESSYFLSVKGDMIEFCPYKSTPPTAQAKWEDKYPSLLRFLWMQTKSLKIQMFKSYRLHK